MTEQSEAATGGAGVTANYNEALLDAVIKPAKTAKPFAYTMPPLKHDRAFRFLARSGNLLAAVQIFKRGGEEQLHSHSAMDGFWFVLKGAVRFYDRHDKVIGEFGPHEGVLIPRDVPYWFESCGDVPLELLQVESIDHSISNTVTTYRAGNDESVDLFDNDGKLAGQGKSSEVSEPNAQK